MEETSLTSCWDPGKRVGSHEGQPGTQIEQGSTPNAEPWPNPGFGSRPLRCMGLNLVNPKSVGQKSSRCLRCSPQGDQEGLTAEEEEEPSERAQGHQVRLVWRRREGRRDLGSQAFAPLLGWGALSP